MERGGEREEEERERERERRKRKRGERKRRRDGDTDRLRCFKSSNYSQTGFWMACGAPPLLRKICVSQPTV